MKKSIIIVVIIAVVILGISILLSGSDSFLDSKRSEAKLRAGEAFLKSFVIQGVIEILTYTDDKNNTIPFDQNPTALKKIDAILDKMKTETILEGDYVYKVYSDSNELFVLKAGEKESGIYVCANTDVVEVKNITAEDFDKKTDCSGEILK